MLITTRGKNGDVFFILPDKERAVEMCFIYAAGEVMWFGYFKRQKLGERPFKDTLELKWRTAVQYVQNKKALIRHFMVWLRARTFLIITHSDIDDYLNIDDPLDRLKLEELNLTIPIRAALEVHHGVHHFHSVMMSDLLKDLKTCFICAAAEIIWYGYYSRKVTEHFDDVFSRTGHQAIQFLKSEGTVVLVGVMYKYADALPSLTCDKIDDFVNSIDSAEELNQPELWAELLYALKKEKQQWQGLVLA